MQRIRIDWAGIVNDLMRAGVSLPEIAAALKVSQGAPYRWLDGSEPKYSSAVLLLSMHRAKCGVHHGEGAAAQHPARSEPADQ
jgi:hypothetical protein